MSKKLGMLNFYLIFRVNWCGWGDLNPHVQRTTDFLTIYGFRRASVYGDLWSGLSLHHSHLALDAARLVSTPS